MPDRLNTFPSIYIYITSEHKGLMKRPPSHSVDFPVFPSPHLHRREEAERGRSLEEVEAKKGENSGGRCGTAKNGQQKMECDPIKIFGRHAIPFFQEKRQNLFLPRRNHGK